MAIQETYGNRPWAFEGQLSNGKPHDVEPMRNDETVAELGFGLAVSLASNTDRRSAKNFTSITDKVAGIVIIQDSYAGHQLGDVGPKPGAEANVIRKGEVTVICEDGCSVGDRLHVRAIAGLGLGNQKVGALLAQPDGANTIDASVAGVWRTAAASGKLAVLEVDFSRKLA